MILFFLLSVRQLHITNCQLYLSLFFQESSKLDLRHAILIKKLKIYGKRPQKKKKRRTHLLNYLGFWVVTSIHFSNNFILKIDGKRPQGKKTRSTHILSSQLLLFWVVKTYITQLWFFNMCGDFQYYTFTFISFLKRVKQKSIYIPLQFSGVLFTHAAAKNGHKTLGFLGNIQYLISNEKELQIFGLLIFST